MPSTPEAVEVFLENKVLFGPGKGCECRRRCHFRPRNVAECHETELARLKRWTTACTILPVQHPRTVCETWQGQRGVRQLRERSQCGRVPEGGQRHARPGVI
ncbi:MAG: hypothetical protein MZV64_04140 [Ignavibacteriales bacterium]|nr:hypothetical protein [Ignavibacteriales bacterium]